MKTHPVLPALLVGLLALLLILSGCASPGPLARAQADYPADRVNARGLFLENCATCHGRDGRARNLHGWLLQAQNLASPDWQATTSDAEIREAIKTGPGAMPAFGKKLSASEITALVSYIRTLNPGW